MEKSCPYDSEKEKYLKEVTQSFVDGICEGNCKERHGEHSGSIFLVRVMSEKTDYGYFSYCERAIDDDETHGFYVKKI